jgi:cyclophilin family peptidyl-prolyl cis-trans isomerase
MRALLFSPTTRRRVSIFVRGAALTVLCVTVACDNNARNDSSSEKSAARTNEAETQSTGESVPAPDAASTSTTAPTTASTSTTTSITPASPSQTSSSPAGSAETQAKEIGPIFATFTSKSGKIKFELFHQESPRACVNFLNLIRRGYYLGKQWDDFSPVVRQLGAAVDVTDLPYQLPREFSPKHLFDEGGLLCLANTTEDARARGHPCRIFITVKPQERWNLNFVVFGRITEGLDVAQNMLYGEPVTAIEISGDADQLLTKYATQVAEWNSKLEAKPLP